MLLVILLSFVCISCATIPNGPGCVELSEGRGWCTMTLSDEEFYIDQDHKYENKTWHEIKATSIIVPASYWANLKAELLKYCKKAKNCPQMTDFKANYADLLIYANAEKIRRKTK